MIGRTFGNYRVEKLIGEGRIGSVFVATDLQQNRKVAIKFIQPNLASDTTFQQRFKQEIQAASTLDHTSIVRILQFSDTPGQLYFVMEYIAGGNLATYLKFLGRDQKAMDSADAMRFSQEIADALEYAFRRQGMTHGDIKLENILLKTSGTSEKRIFQAVLSDFGAAKLIQNIPGPFAGPSNTSLPFMSPERCRGERVDTRSDIYALGVILYYLTTGQLPFQPRSINEAVQMHTRNAVVPPSRVVSTIPREIEQIILKSLAKNPNDRYQTPGEISQALYGARFGGPRATHTVVEAAVPGGKQLRTYYADAPLNPEMPQYGNFPASAADVGKIRLVFSSQNHPASFLWFDKPVVTIGRDATNDIVLDSGQISRHHARVDRGYDGRYRIMDLRSTNGVYLGSNKIPSNVPAEWSVGQIARVGDFWMRLEQVSAPSVGQNAAAGIAAPVPTANIKSEAPVPVAAPALTNDELLEHDSPLLKTDFGQSLYTVAPGNRVVIPIKVTNQSDVNDRYAVEVRGLPADWMAAQADELRLAPQQTGGAQVIINPPRTGESLAGSRPFSIVVRSFQKPTEYDAKKFQLQIESFFSFTTDLHPKRVRSNGSSEFYVTNNGNSPDTFVVALDEPGEEVDIRLDQSELKVDPGQTARVQIQAVPRGRSFIGSNKSYPFRVSAKPKRTGGEVQVQTAELVVSPVIPYWLAGGLGLTATGCVGLIALFLFLGATGIVNFQRLLQGNGITPTAIVNPNGTPVPTSATSVASLPGADTDGDGLSDELETKSLGTNPNSRDSDSDGLSDFDEVKVKFTNPNNPDTDGDGLSDLVDPQPLVKAPPTPDAAASLAAEGTAANNSATSVAVNGTATAAQATASVPAISINDPPPVAEGNINGTTELVFTISLSKPNPGPNPITVNYAFVDGTAKNGADPTNADSDYNGSGAIPPSPITFAVGGPTSQVLRVPIVSNTLPETSFETFAVQLSGAIAASIAKGTGIGTISDEDSVLAQPSVSIDDVSGNENVTPMTFHVSASLPAGSPVVKVPFNTANGSATAGTDFTTASGTLSFGPCPAGTSPCPLATTIPVTITDDSVVEATESFSVVLGPVAGVSFVKGTGTGTIIDNDGITASISDPAPMSEGNVDGLTKLIFTVTLSQAPTTNLAMGFFTQDGSAISTGTTPDFTAQGTSATPIALNFLTGQTSATIIIDVRSDIIPETSPETFTVRLTSPPAGLTFTKAVGTGTINDDDVITMSVGDPSVIEGSGGGACTTMNFVVTLSQSSPASITANFFTTDGSAIAPGDYTSTAITTPGTVTIPANTLQANIPIPVICDSIVESDETFTVTLINASGATIVKNVGTGTILNDDSPAVLPTSTPVPVTITIDDPPGVVEGDPTGGCGGFPPPLQFEKNVVEINFTVTLSQVSTGTITVNFNISNGSAITNNPDTTEDLGDDYVWPALPTLGAPPRIQLTFFPGQLVRTISVPIVSDCLSGLLGELPVETFTVTLSGATNSAGAIIIGKSQGIGTIIEDPDF